MTLAVVGGGCSSTITDNSIFRILDNAGISWKLYAESLPNAGYMGGDAGEYAQRHNPAKWYSDIVNNSADQQKMVPFTQFAADLNANQLPTYSIIIPNLLDDAHDGSPAQADAWLQSNVGPLLNQSYFQPGGDGLLIITFDNGDADNPGQVYTTLIGPKVTPHTVSNTPYMHQNVLRTILAAVGASSFPGVSANASAMADFFASGQTGVTISAPTSGAQVSSPVTFNATATSSGLPVTAMKVYLGNNLLNTFNGNGTSSLTVNTSFTISPGSNTLTANAWDTAGNLYHSAVTFTVGGSAGVAINAPSSGSQVASPVAFDATATSNGLPITAMKIYLGPNLVNTFNGNGTSTLRVNTSFPAPAGSQTITANAWDTSGNLYQSKVTFTVTGSSGVSINAPSPGSQVTSPVAFTASATSNGLPVTAMKVYLDPNLLNTYNGNGTATLNVNASYNIAAGSHTLTANAWDTSGTLYQSKVTFTVVSSAGVAITSPVAGAQVGSPVSFSATATSNGLPVTAMKVYLGSTLLMTYNGNGSSSSLSVNDSYSISPGTHTLTANAWDTNGNLYQSAVTFTVQ